MISIQFDENVDGVSKFRIRFFKFIGRVGFPMRILHQSNKIWFIWSLTHLKNSTDVDQISPKYVWEISEQMLEGRMSLEKKKKKKKKKKLKEKHTKLYLKLRNEDLVL